MENLNKIDQDQLDADLSNITNNDIVTINDITYIIKNKIPKYKILPTGEFQKLSNDSK